jgi:hydroxyacylglutathione hydrolase
MPEVVMIETPSLGDRSYLAHDGESGIVVDPQRDTGRVLAAAEAAGVRITHVLETHIHNDYVTGGLALAAETGAEYVVAACEDVSFRRTAIGDGGELAAGRLVIRAVHTPGHTPGHLSYVLREDGGGPVAVFTGGSMLFGAVGRTDLVSPERTEELTRAQYRSVRRLAAELPADTAVYPTHGFGSFCSATPASGQAATIGEQRRANVALGSDEDTFVKELLAGLTAYPRYYAHMAPLNRRGPGAFRPRPPAPASPEELRHRIEAGEWVVDLRDRRAFAAGHVTGTVSIELGGSFATLLGWTVPWGSPLTLVAATAEQIQQAQVELARIGIDQLAGAAAGPPEALAPGGRVSGYRVTGFAGLAAQWGEPGIVVLDVRRPDEWQAGHLAGAVHIPFWELPQRLGEVPPGEVWVHCAVGLRAAIGASILARAGRPVVLIDDDWPPAAQLSLPVSG